MKCIAPELIILRVMLGRGWSTKTVNTNTSPQTPHTIVFGIGSESNIDHVEHEGVTAEVGMQKAERSGATDTV